MSLKNALKKVRDGYIINQVRKIKLPVFDESDAVRLGITFFGRVQKVGFRLEVKELSDRLELTGFCQNLPGGSVYCELQGEKDKINYLIAFMESLVRIKIRNKEVKELDFIHGETEFKRF